MPHYSEQPGSFDPYRPESWRAETDDRPEPEADNEALNLEKNQEFSERYRQIGPLGETVLGRAGFRVRVDEKAESFSFDARSKEITVSPKLIEGLKLSDEEQTYLFVHEIAHFVQMLQSPDAYLGTFQKAKEETEAWPSNQQSQIQEAWRRYFNVFLDIHDNSIVEGRLPRFQQTQTEAHPRQSFYAKAFAETDFTNHPLHLQFCYGALRRAMRPTDEIVVNEMVQARLDEPFMYLGRRYESLQSFINTEIFNAETSLEKILFRLEQLIEPVFRELLSVDSQAEELEQPSESFDIKDFDQMDETDVEDIIKEIKEVKKSASERAADQARQEFNDKMLAAGFSEQEVTRMHEIRERADEIYKNLVDLWEVFLHITYRPERIEEEGFRSGQEISIRQFVKQLPDLLVDPAKTRLFRRKTMEKAQESIEPRKINLHLILDLSGSMDKDKREAVQESAYAVAKSLIQFRRNLAVRMDGQSPVDIHLRLTGFGSSVQELLQLDSEEQSQRTLKDDRPEELDQKLWRAIMGIQRLDLGGTVDAKALQEAETWISDSKTQAELAQNRETAVVLEITDGETSTANQSTQIIKQLNEIDNVYTRGIKIPGAIYGEETVKESERERKESEIHPESGAFEQVWRQNGTRLSDIKVLREVMQKILFTALKDQDKR